jgi:general secretion pathway protein H
VNAQRGFTLIELLVVVALLAIVTAAASLAIRDPAQTRLEREAERLCALLESARAEARTQGLAVRWRPRVADDGSSQFQFEGLPAKHGLPERWQGDAPAVIWNGSANALALGPEPLLPPQSLTLRLNGAEVRVGSDGLSAFDIQRESK